MSPESRHASCVRWLGRGILLEGRSGAGKSDLALRLIEAGADLVADDLVLVEQAPSGLRARGIAPFGRIERRGGGILELPAAAATPLDLVVALGMPGDAPAERLPEQETTTILGRELPTLRLDARAPSAVGQLRLHLLSVRVA